MAKANGSMTVREQIDELKESLHQDLTKIFTWLERHDKELMQERYQRKFLLWKVSLVSIALSSIGSVAMTSAFWYFKMRGG